MAFMFKVMTASPEPNGTTVTLETYVSPGEANDLDEVDRLLDVFHRKERIVRGAVYGNRGMAIHSAETIEDLWRMIGHLRVGEDPRSKEAQQEDVVVQWGPRPNRFGNRPEAARPRAIQYYDVDARVPQAVGYHMAAAAPVPRNVGEPHVEPIDPPGYGNYIPAQPEAPQVDEDFDEPFEEGIP